jgi:hypothetical protein
MRCGGWRAHAAFYAAGRHPLAGILAAFAANNFLVATVAPTGLDMVLQGFTQKAAQILDPTRTVNPLCNWVFMVAAAVATTLTCWLVIDRVVEPRLARVAVDGDPADLPAVEQLSDRDRRSLLWAALAAVAVLVLIALAAAPSRSPLRATDGSLTGNDAGLMKGIVPLLLLLAVVPGLVFGYHSGRVTGHKDVIRAMSHTMSSMGYFMVLVFFAAQFIRGFAESNLGALVALEGGLALKALALPPLVTIGGLIGMTSVINVLIASASAKWAMLSSIFVPMLMTAGISPEATQLAYRIGDSPTTSSRRSTTSFRWCSPSAPVTCAASASVPSSRSASRLPRRASWRSSCSWRRSGSAVCRQASTHRTCIRETLDRVQRFRSETGTGSSVERQADGTEQHGVPPVFCLQALVAALEGSRKPAERAQLPGDRHVGRHAPVVPDAGGPSPAAPMCAFLEDGHAEIRVARVVGIHVVVRREARVREPDAALDEQA